MYSLFPKRHTGTSCPRFCTYHTAIWAMRFLVVPAEAGNSWPDMIGVGSVDSFDTPSSEPDVRISPHPALRFDGSPTKEDWRTETGA